MVNVLVVDDSIFMRKAIVEMLTSSPEINVVGQARNGKEGLDLAKRLKPDIITLDIEMPVMDGLTMLEELMKTNPIPVIMISSLTSKGAESTFKALELGALDFVPKYTGESCSINDLKDVLCQKIIHVSQRGKFLQSILKRKVGGGSFARVNTASSLKSTIPSTENASAEKRTSTSPINKLKDMMKKPVQNVTDTSSTSHTSSTLSHTSGHTPGNPSSSSLSSHSHGTQKAKTENTGQPTTYSPTFLSGGNINILTVPSGASKVKYVGIGISTGGPPAIQKLLISLPKNFPAAILVAQHMPALFTKSFASRLDSLCQLKVKEAENGEVAKIGTVYIAPGGQHLSLHEKGGVPYLTVSTEPVSELYKPSANVLFQSLAPYAQKSLGVIMTGMGNDGLKGLQAFKEHRGKIIAQNEESCVVYGMPKAVVGAGLADEVKDLDALATTIIQYLYK